MAADTCTHDAGWGSEILSKHWQLMLMMLARLGFSLRSSGS